jgi:hypothetical protein
LKLEGSIDAFGLPDILQLLSATQKSGALRIHQELAATDGSATGQLSGVVRLAEGNISGASSDMSRQSLARRVVGAALVGDDVLSAAVEQVRFAGTGGVVRALITAGAISEDEVLPVARLQTTDAVCELLRWTSGNFSFRDAEADPDNLSLRLPVEELVAEGQRRLATWPALTALVPSAATVLSLSIAPSTDPVCSREEWALLALVDGRRTVAEIVALLGAGEYAIVRALAALVERGLLVNSEGGNNGISGLADLERRQGLLAVLESGQPIPQPRTTAEEATAAPIPADVSPALAEAPLTVEVPAVEVPVLAASVTSAVPTATAATEHIGFTVPAVPVAAAAIPVVTATAAPTAVVAAAAPAPAAGEFVGTTFQLSATAAAAAPVEVPVPVAVPTQLEAPAPTFAAPVESTIPVPNAPAAPPVTPVTMGNVAMAPETVPAVPAPLQPGDDDPAVTRSTLLRLIAGVQGL